MAHRFLIVFLVVCLIGACGPSIDPIERESHWQDVANEVFSETQTLDSFTEWLRSNDIHDDLYPLLAKTEDNESQFLVQLEDLGNDWVCRYSVHIQVFADSTNTITGHHVYYVSTCL